MVAQYSPLLAGRLAVSSDKGVTEVVEAIQGAMSPRDRQRLSSAGVSASAVLREPDFDDGLFVEEEKAVYFGSQKKTKLKDLKESGDYDLGFDLLVPEERILLSMASGVSGVTMAKASSNIVSDRLERCPDRLVDEELLIVEVRNGEKTWLLSEAGKSFIRANYWATLL